MSKKYISWFISIIMLAIVTVPFFVQADPTVTNNPGNTVKNTSFDIKIENPFQKDTIQGLIEVIVKDILMPVGGVIAVLMIMYAGFLYVTAAGNETKIKKAHQALTWAVIGASILLGAWVISQAISATIGKLK